jgi:hypothetical protein
MNALNPIPRGRNALIASAAGYFIAALIWTLGLTVYLGLATRLPMSIWPMLALQWLVRRDGHLGVALFGVHILASCGALIGYALSKGRVHAVRIWGIGLVVCGLALVLASIRWVNATLGR